MPSATQSLNAQMRVVRGAKVIEDSQWNRDLSQPDDKTEIWPQPIDPKTDVAVIIIRALQAIGISATPDPATMKVVPNAMVAVVFDGSFSMSMLKDESQNKRPVIVVNRSGDVPTRKSLGELQAVRTGGQSDLIDVGPAGQPIATPGAVIEFKGQWFDTTLDVWIFDMNGYRANQLYYLIQTIMIVSAKAMREQIGYLDVIQTNGMDQPALGVDQGFPAPVTQRFLTFRLSRPHFVASVPQVAALIKQTFLEAQSDGTQAAVTTDV